MNRVLVSATSFNQDLSSKDVSNVMNTRELGGLPVQSSRRKTTGGVRRPTVRQPVRVPGYHKIRQIARTKYYGNTGNKVPNGTSRTMLPRIKTECSK